MTLTQFNTKLHVTVHDSAWQAWWLELDKDVADAIVALLGLPVEHHTISYFAALAARAGEAWGVALCAFLNQIDAGHCDNVRNLRRAFQRCDA